MPSITSILANPSATIPNTRDGGLADPRAGKIFGGSGSRVIHGLEIYVLISLRTNFSHHARNLLLSIHDR